MIHDYFWVRNIIYKEYTHTALNDVGTSLHEKEYRKFDITPFRLTKSIVKSITTKYGRSKFTDVLFVCWFLQLGVMITEDADGYLELGKEVKNGLFRDFSQTSRCGELAQGINYYFLERVLGALDIFDFKEYFNNYTIGISCPLSTPDFVFRTQTEINILESKGDNVRDYPTRVLRKAKKGQCTIGQKALRAEGIICNKSYASVVKFNSLKCAEREVCIHFGDPEYDQRVQKLRVSNIKHEYSKWFDMLGRREMADQLLDNQPFLSEEAESDKNGFLPLRRFILDIDRYKIEVELGVMKDLWELINNSNASAVKYLDMREGYKKGIIEWNNNLSFKSGETFYTDIDIDGTYMKAVWREDKREVSKIPASIPPQQHIKLR